MKRMPMPGEPAPWFHARALNGNERYAFDTSAGRYVLMLFLGSGAQEPTQSALKMLRAHRNLFDDARACFYGVTIDPSDAAEGRIVQEMPGLRWFLDYDRAVSKLYGAIDASGGEKIAYSPHWLLLDPMLRVVARVPLTAGEDILRTLRGLVGQTPAPVPAPVLVMPGILPPDLCRTLIGLYEQHGGVESGFMREEGGQTVARSDHSHKRRADHVIEDADVIATLKGRMSNALRPMIRRAFQFDASRIERFIVACYDAQDGGHFRAHRDNTTRGTAHRKFACTINLNAEEFEGGDLSFPEFGPTTYRAPTGGAVVFSCSLLHEARPVTKGRRFAFLPFLYDDDGARIREANLAHVAPELRYYRSGLETAAK